MKSFNQTEGKAMDKEYVVIEERQRLVGYISKTGHVCLKQFGVGPSEDDIIHIDPDDVDTVIHALGELQTMAKILPVDGG